MLFHLPICLAELHSRHTLRTSALHLPLDPRLTLRLLRVPQPPPMVDSLSATMERDTNPLAAKSSRLDEDGVLSTGFENYEGASTDRVSLQLPESGDVLDGRRREYPTLLPYLSLTDPDL